jgi:hypothetical protein
MSKEKLNKVLQVNYGEGVVPQIGEEKPKRKRKKPQDSAMKAGVKKLTEEEKKKKKKGGPFKDEDAVMPSNTAGSY